MTATTNDRNTIETHTERTITIPLTASTKIPNGVMVSVVLATGTAINAADTASSQVMGVSNQQVDTALGHAFCNVRRGVFWFAQDGTITAASIGKLCEVVDNQTVSLTTTTNHIPAGYIEAVDATKGVLIAMLGGKIGAA